MSAVLDEGLVALATLVDRLHADLDVLSYYNLLGVAPDASADEIRQAFHGRALLLHPDRFFSLSDTALRDRIGAVYKRVAEGYRVLNQPDQRTGYDRLIAGGEMRYSRAAAEAAARETQSEEPKAGEPGIANHQARQFYNMGKAELKRQDFSAAASYLEQALAMEPRSGKIRVALEEAQRLQRLYGG